MSVVADLNAKLETLTRWNERVKVFRIVYLALVGIKILGNDPLDSALSAFFAVVPMFGYCVIEEIRIRLDSTIRSTQKLLEKEKQRDKANQAWLTKLRRRNESRIG